MLGFDIVALLNCLSFNGAYFYLIKITSITVCYHHAIEELYCLAIVWSKAVFNYALLQSTFFNVSFILKNFFLFVNCNSLLLIINTFRTIMEFLIPKTIKKRCFSSNDQQYQPMVNHFTYTKTENSIKFYFPHD